MTRATARREKGPPLRRPVGGSEGLWNAGGEWG